MVGLYKDPNGEKIFCTTTPGLNDTTPNRLQVGGDRMVISALEGRIKELECELAEKKVLGREIFLSLKSVYLKDYFC